MKLLSKYKNKNNNITYQLYELPNGIRLIHLDNPATVNFDFAIIHKAGAVYEDLEQVPHGTAHMLEHMLFRPNTQFKTDQEIYKFEQGNKNRPAIYLNGGTSKKYLYLNGHANEAGAIRILERISSMIGFPKEKLAESFEVEKGIVIAERSRDIKTEKDKFLQYIKYLEGDIYPEFIYPTSGEINDIKNISMDDIEKYFHNRFTKENVTLAVQSKGKLPREVQEKIQEITNKYPDRESKTFDKRILSNKLNIGSFYDERSNGTSIFLSYFEDNPKGCNLKRDAINNLFSRLIRKFGEEILRDKLGLIYSMNIDSIGFLAFNYSLRELNFVIENSKIKESLDALDKFLFCDLQKFLESSRGEEWFQHILSLLIYPRTVEYDAELAEGITYTYIEDDCIYNANEYREIAKSIKKEDLIKRIKEFQKTQPYFWIESNLRKQNVERIVKQSSLWKRFK
jgi:predicted Zn-dependent peptidase